MSPEGVAILKKWIAEKWWSMLLLFFAAFLTVVGSIFSFVGSSLKNYNEKKNAKFLHVTII